MALELRTSNQTIINDINFEYSRIIDDINRAVITLAGNTNFQRNLLGVGNYIEIYNNGVLDFRGKINSSGNIEGNSVKLIVRGEEEEYVKDNCDTSVLGTSGVWKSTASATIAAAILNTGVHYSAGTIDTGTNIDFRVANSDSKWNAFINLSNKVGQDKYVDYINQEIDLLNSLGSSNVDTLNEGTDFDFMYYQESEAKAKKVVVYGKGDGNNQLSATATSGSYVAGEDNLEVINDPTCISSSELQERADTELAALENNIKVYEIPVNNPFKTYSIGDTLTVNAPSYDINGDTVRIVKITRGRRGKNQFLNIEVTNEGYSRTIRSARQKIAQQASENRNKQTYMQGSGNTLTFGNQINATSGAPLIVPFQLPDSFIKDEAGTIRVTTMTLDYDVDPYRKGVGTASFDGSDPQVQNISDTTQPTVTGTSGASEIWESIGSDSASFTAGTGGFSTELETSSFDTDDYYMLNVTVTVSGPTSVADDETLAWEIEVDGAQQIVDFKTDFGNSSYSAAFKIGYIVRSTQSGSGTVAVGFRASTSMSISASVTVYGALDTHTHDDGSYSAANHSHNDGTYDINASDIDDISIGDSVSDAGSVNATSVNIYLDYWNGSAWINKHSILTTGQTLDTDVDITDSGTYPDASGFWRVRVYPNNASPDLVKGIVKLKHSLDN